jgi:hypothetical protein
VLVRPNPGGFASFAREAAASREVRIGALLGGAFLGGIALAATVGYIREAQLDLGPAVEIVDVQAQAAGARYKKSGNLKRRSFRDWDQLTGIVLHQIGVRNVGRAAYPNVTAHIGVHHDGTIYRIHPLPTRRAASDALNPDTVSIEVAGLFGKDTPIPQAQVYGLRQAIRLIQQEVAANGGQIEAIYAHRQGAKDRPLDPQAGLWREGALWAEERLGIPTRPTYTRAQGRPIPRSWDPRMAA